MKIIDARTGKLQPIPFALGEAGRGRHLERADTAPWPGREARPLSSAQILALFSA